MESEKKTTKMGNIEEKSQDESSCFGGNTNSKARMRARRWTLTINNPVYEDKRTYFNTLTLECHKYIFALETGKSGTPHIQGYVSFKNAKSFSAMKKKYPTAHIEAAKGDEKSNFKYCSKDGDYITNMTFDEDFKNIILREEYSGVVWRE